MFRHYLLTRHYFGEIVLGSQARNWVSRHRSFATDKWVKDQVRYGKWIRTGRNRSSTYATTFEGIKPIKVKIDLIYCQRGNQYCPVEHVYVEHAHLL